MPCSSGSLTSPRNLLNVPGQKLGHPLLWSTKSNCGKTLQVPVRNFALEFQLVWPPEVSMGHWLFFIRLICATWGPVLLAVKTSGFPHLSTPPSLSLFMPTYMDLDSFFRYHPRDLPIASRNFVPGAQPREPPAAILLTYIPQIPTQKKKQHEKVRKCVSSINY